MFLQTITRSIAELKHMDENGDFQQTDFDNEVQGFIESIIEDDHVPLATHFLTSGDNLICIIQYVEMTPEMKKQASAQKSGLTLLNNKIVSPDIK